MRQQLRRTILAVTLLLFSFSASFGASVSIAPPTGNSFTVQGSSMDGVAGIQLDIAYDAASLASPNVTQGGLVSGAMLAANTSIPGQIKIAIISTKPFSGSGIIASINFGKGSGSLKIVSQKMIDSSGSSFDAASTNDSGFITSPGVPFSQPSSTSTTSTTGNAPINTATIGSASGNIPPSSSIPTYLGTVSMPSDTSTQQPPKQPAPVEQPPMPVASAPPPSEASPPETSKSSAPVEEKTEAVKQVTNVGILERFRSYEGEKTPAKLSALFTKEVTPAMRQKPAIAVSDGTSTVSVTLELPVSDVSPNFAISGAKLASIGKENETGKWIIELLPHAAVFRATLTVLIGNRGIDFPLTVIPPVSGMKFTDKDFAEFMKDSGAAKPKFDLNGDGRHDYVDNYIYTGHYLLHNDVGKKVGRKDTK